MSSASELPPLAVIIDDNSTTATATNNNEEGTSNQEEKPNSTQQLQPRKPEIHYQTAAATRHLQQQQPKTELERLLVDQIAACHLKDDEILSLEQNLIKTRKELEQERDMSKRLRNDLSLIEDSLVAERSARKSAQHELETFKQQNGSRLEEFKRIAEEMSYFEGVKNVSDKNQQQTLVVVADQVTSLIRAFMSLQLELVRTIKVSQAQFTDNCIEIFSETVFKPEQDEFKRIFLEFETNQRTLEIAEQESKQRSEIDSGNKAIELRVLATSVMLQEHSKLFGKSAFDFCAKAEMEWINVSSLYVENQKKVAAQKLRQANTKLKKALEESEEKSKTIEEAKRNYNLLKARFDVRSKEQAAKPSASSSMVMNNTTSSVIGERKAETHTGGRKNSTTATATRPSSSTGLQQRKERNEATSTSVRPSTPPLQTSSSLTTGGIDLNETPIPQQQQQQKKPARVFDFTPKPIPSSSDNNNNIPSSSTPPPSFLLPPATSSTSRRNSQTTSANLLFQNHQSVSGTQTPILRHQQQAAAATSLYNDLVSMVETIGEDHRNREFIQKVTSDLADLRKHLSLLEEAIVRKDERLNRVLEERNSLNKECDAIATQCRLLEQACKFGAKKTAEQGAKFVLMRMMKDDGQEQEEENYYYE